MIYCVSVACRVLVAGLNIDHMFYSTVMMLLVLKCIYAFMILAALLSTRTEKPCSQTSSVCDNMLSVKYCYFQNHLEDMLPLYYYLSMLFKIITLNSLQNPAKTNTPTVDGNAVVRQSLLICVTLNH